ncbi:MAG: hypothetical protein JWQ35_1087 [Bacteriovoracaceae bacterium]|nr:hypothetical protein [Bacteriovoracaceae bacterium]
MKTFFIKILKWKLTQDIAILFFILFSTASLTSIYAAKADPCVAAIKKVWQAKAETTEDRLKLLVSLLDRHPNIVTANLTFKRSLLETYAHLPVLLKHLGSEAASFETAPATIRRLRYVASGEAKANEQAIRNFLEARVADLESLDLQDGGDLVIQIRRFKENSKKPDGAFDEKAFSKKVRKLLQVLPLLFNSDGKALFNVWAKGANVISATRNLTAGDLESRYGDLMKEHLSEVIGEISKEKGFGQVKVLFENVRGLLVEKELKIALTPVTQDGKAVEERSLSLETLPAWVGLVRGCYGGDCSILSVPYYPLVKGTKVHFIRKGPDSTQPSGYAVSAPVTVNGKTLPYILTINGVTLTEADIQMSVRAIAEDYGAHEVIFPDFKAHPNMVNSDAARKGMSSEKAKRVTVRFSAGWKLMDSAMKELQVAPYTNYYHGPDIESANLARLSAADPRILESRIEQAPAVSYHEVEDLLTIPLIQRAILGVQALSSDDEMAVKMKDVLKILNLLEKQVEAARPLTELTAQRVLTAKEYRLAEEELGFGLQNILELESEARSATLRSLYREEPKLFSEQKVRSHPKAVNALVEAYGSSFPEEIRNILKAKDLSDGQTLKLLEALKPALTEGDLSKAQAFQKQFEGTSLEAWARDAIPLAFIRMNTADTALGRKLVAALSSRDSGFALAALKQPSPRESLMLRAFQEIARVIKTQDLKYDQARDRWLSDAGGSAKAKARFLGMSLISPKVNGESAEISKAKLGKYFDPMAEFKKLFSQIPDTQKEEVENTIDEFSSFKVFAGLGKESEQTTIEKPVAKPGILQRLLGRTETVVKTADPAAIASLLVLSNLKVESFEYVQASIPVEGAKFMMGSPPTEPDRYTNEAQREVILTQPFQMQATPVTQWQWERVMGKNPARFTSGESAHNRPVEQVSWEEVQTFIQKMNRLDSKWNYRLPTEAEWEFVARAGTTSAYSFGNDSAELKAHAHFAENADSQTHPVTEKHSNPLGLYDIHGNVWEWVSDWYGETLQGGVDPLGPSSGSYRVLRGGSWGNGAQSLRSAVRDGGPPGGRGELVGFRLVRTLK